MNQLFSKFGWKFWSGEEFFSNFIFHNCIQLEKAVVLHLNKLNFPWSMDNLCQVWLKLAQKQVYTNTYTSDNNRQRTKFDHESWNELDLNPLNLNYIKLFSNRMVCKKIEIQGLFSMKESSFCISRLCIKGNWNALPFGLFGKNSMFWYGRIQKILTGLANKNWELWNVCSISHHSWWNNVEQTFIYF